MSDIRLPQRPMVELLPPVDGLDQVRGEAGRRRRRRAGFAAASVSTAAGIAVVMALSGGPGGLAVLKPAPPAGQGVVQPTPTPSEGHRSTVVGPAKASGLDGGRPVPGHKTGRAPSGGPVVATIRSDPNRTPPPGGQVSRAQQPQLQRWQSTYTDSPARQCSGSTYGDGSDTLESSVGWCLDVMASPVSDGVQLHIRLCRDSTGGGTLKFEGAREVDLAVQQGGKTVWDWAAMHPGGARAHQLSEPANGCMNWSLVWPDLTTGGRSAGHGNFTFVGTSTADEMKGKPDESAAFAY